MKKKVSFLIQIKLCLVSESFYTLFFLCFTYLYSIEKKILDEVHILLNCQNCSSAVSQSEHKFPLVIIINQSGLSLI